MARRSSARLQARNAATPKRVSLSHDAPPARAPQTVPTKLASLEESDEMPGAFPRSASPPGNSTPTRPAKRLATGLAETPRDVSPIEPTDEEMHPQKHHRTTVKSVEEVCYPDLMCMIPHTAPPSRTSSGVLATQNTPSKVSGENAVPAPAYQFTFRREHSLELSPEAKKLMSEKREEVARIRERMMAEGDKGKGDSETSSREIATPKTKKSRFSGVHNAQFERMESIAGHPSAFRAKPPAPTLQKTDNSRPESKSLKRSPSKAQLDEPTRTIAAGVTHTPKAEPDPAANGLPRLNPSYGGTSSAQGTSSSPNKRMKQSSAEDVSAARSKATDADHAQPTTPQQAKTPRMRPTNPNFVTATTPTQASLAKAASTRSVSRIPAPASITTPAKLTSGSAATVPLLARSPTKPAVYPSSAQAGIVAQGGREPLFKWSPLKPSPRKVQAGDSGDTRPAECIEPPLLARSPLKMSAAKSPEVVVESTQGPNVPLLARSPCRIALPAVAVTSPTLSSTERPFGSGLMGRFNLLRASPMKSILRAPQRLYSDDPAQVAAGTHFATPPKTIRPTSLTPGVTGPATAPVKKHVDFTSSTKERWEAGQKAQEAPSTPTKPTTPKVLSKENTPERDDMEVAYPTLPMDITQVSPSPQKRRKTSTPGDFTFRANEHGIIFSQSPNAPPGSSRSNRASTVRHISSNVTAPPAPPVQGSKKRKFEFENAEAVTASAIVGLENSKENTAPSNDVPVETEERPTKRTKTGPSANSAPSSSAKLAAAAAAASARRTTLGVKPKGVKTDVPGRDKKVTSISQARLNALAMPKKRG